MNMIAYYLQEEPCHGNKGSDIHLTTASGMCQLSTNHSMVDMRTDTGKASLKILRYLFL